MSWRDMVERNWKLAKHFHWIWCSCEIGRVVLVRVVYNYNLQRIYMIWIPIAVVPSFTRNACTVYPKKYAHGVCFAVLYCGYTLTDFPISIRLTSLALWQSNDCPSASKATLMNMDEYFMWIHYERLHNHNKAKHNKTVCIFLGIYCMCLCTSGINWVNNCQIVR